MAKAVKTKNARVDATFKKSNSEIVPVQNQAHDLSKNALPEAGLAHKKAKPRKWEVAVKTRRNSKKNKNASDMLHDGNILYVKDYTQKFKNFCMKDVNFEVKRNTIHALIGESGSGKSVIIESIIGALPSFKGKIFINNYSSLSAKSKMQIGYSTNLENFPSELSAYSFLKLLGQLTSLKSKFLIEKLDSLLVDFGLWEHRNKNLKTILQEWKTG